MPPREKRLVVVDRFPRWWPAGAHPRATVANPSRCWPAGALPSPPSTTASAHNDPNHHNDHSAHNNQSDHNNLNDSNEHGRHDHHDHFDHNDHNDHCNPKDPNEHATPAKATEERDRVHKLNVIAAGKKELPAEEPGAAPTTTTTTTTPTTTTTAATPTTAKATEERDRVHISNVIAAGEKELSTEELDIFTDAAGHASNLAHAAERISTSADRSFVNAATPATAKATEERDRVRISNVIAAGEKELSAEELDIFTDAAEQANNLAHAAERISTSADRSFVNAIERAVTVPDATERFKSFAHAPPAATEDRDLVHILKVIAAGEKALSVEELVTTLPTAAKRVDTSANADLVQFHGHGPALASEIPCGQPVSLIGLKAEHMNGTVGALGPWDQKSKRFQVLMPDSSIKMIKPCNLTDPDDSDAD